MPLNLHGRIDIHPRRAPFGLDIGLDQERLERRLVHGLEDGLPTSGALLEGTAIQDVEGRGQQGVELGQTEDGRDHGEPVVLGQIGTSRVQLRLIPTDLGHARAEIVGVSPSGSISLVTTGSDTLRNQILNCINKLSSPLSEGSNYKAVIFSIAQKYLVWNILSAHDLETLSGTLSIVLCDQNPA